MKKITILALHLGVGGIEKYISSLCKMLENDYEIKVISTYKKYDKPKFEFSDKIEIKYLINDSPKKDELKQAIKNKKVIISLKYLCKNILLLLKKYIENIKEIKKIDSDYVITTRDFHNKLVGRYCDKKIIKIATEHNHHNNNKKYINKVIKSIKNFNYFVLVSKELEEFYKDKIGSTKAVYIPNVIEDMPTFKSKIENNNIISIGRMSPEKGFINFIEIISEIKKDIEDIKLNLIGDGPELENIKKEIKAHDLTKNIILHGFLNKKEIESIMLESSLYVMTSYTESFGLVLIEAMSYGVPCVSFSSARGAVELIEKDSNLIKERDNKLMAKKIINLLNNKKELKKQSKQSIEYSKQFLISEVVTNWKKLLKTTK
ncbi:MAG: glycosyltransferase [Bacilli bacterium]